MDIQYCICKWRYNTCVLSSAESHPESLLYVIATIVVHTVRVQYKHICYYQLSKTNACTNCNKKVPNSGLGKKKPEFGSLLC
jgi:hypothetical protein